MTVATEPTTTTSSATMKDGRLTVTMEAGLFREIVTWATHAVCKDPTFPALCGVHFTIGEPQVHVPHFTQTFESAPMGTYAITAACTDRYRVAWASAPTGFHEKPHQQPLGDSEPVTGPFNMLIPAAELLNSFKAWPRTTRFMPTVFLRFDFDAKGRPVELQVETVSGTTRIPATEGTFPKYESFVSNEWLDEPAGPMGFDSRYLAQLATAATKASSGHTLRLRTNGKKPAAAMVNTDSDVRVSALLMPIRVAS